MNHFGSTGVWLKFRNSGVSLLADGRLMLLNIRSLLICWVLDVWGCLTCRNPIKGDGTTTLGTPANRLPWLANIHEWHEPHINGRCNFIWHSFRGYSRNTKPLLTDDVSGWAGQEANKSHDGGKLIPHSFVISDSFFYWTHKCLSQSTSFWVTTSFLRKQNMAKCSWNELGRYILIVSSLNEILVSCLHKLVIEALKWITASGLPRPH